MLADIESPNKLATSRSLTCIGVSFRKGKECHLLYHEKQELKILPSYRWGYHGKTKRHLKSNFRTFRRFPSHWQKR